MLSGYVFARPGAWVYKEALPSWQAVDKPNASGYTTPNLRIAAQEKNMSWLEKLLPPRIQRSDAANRKTMPEGLWVKCPSCEAVLYRSDLESNLHVCPKCDHHMRIRARERLDALLDAGGRYEIGQETLPVDTLKFKDSKKYPDRLKAAMDATGETDALIVQGGSIMSLPVVVA